MTHNNQQSFHLLTIFEQHVTSAHLHCFRDLFVRDVCCKRQEQRPTSHHPGRLAGMEIFAQAMIFEAVKLSVMMEGAKTLKLYGKLLSDEAREPWERSK